MRAFQHKEIGGKGAYIYQFYFHKMGPITDIANYNNRLSKASLGNSLQGRYVTGSFG